jgi:GNAT superfamily N-acetyltransferase
MVLREATHDDISTLVALIHTAFEEYRGRLEPPSGVHRETTQSIGTYLQQGRAVLALLNDQAVGCVCYHQEGQYVYFGRLAVLPVYRQHGVGLALIAYVEQQAQETRSPAGTDWRAYSPAAPASILRTPGLPRRALRDARGLHRADLCGHGETDFVVMYTLGIM